MSGKPLDLVVVDNGSEEAERRSWRPFEPRVVDPGANLGYGAGLNLAMTSIGASRIAVANPDCRLLAGGLDALSLALEDAAIAGPSHFWDEDLVWRLPPAERRTRVGEVLDALAPSSPRLARWARARWRRHAHRHWAAQEPLRSHALTGAFLAFRREAWNRVGPFDPGFRLYFEETDWLLRAQRRGLEALYVPAARAVHEVGASARREPLAQTWFEESAARFRRKAWGESFAGWVERLAAGRADGPPTIAPPPGAGRRRPAWVELSPRAVGYPAARAAAPEPRQSQDLWALPPLPQAALEGRWWASWLDERGHEIARSPVTPRQ